MATAKLLLPTTRRQPRHLKTRTSSLPKSIVLTRQTFASPMASRATRSFIVRNLISTALTIPPQHLESLPQRRIHRLFRSPKGRRYHQLHAQVRSTSRHPFVPTDIIPDNLSLPFLTSPPPTSSNSKTLTSSSSSPTFPPPQRPLHPNSRQQQKSSATTTSSVSPLTLQLLQLQASLPPLSSSTATLTNTSLSTPTRHLQLPSLSSKHGFNSCLSLSLAR